jgi:uncharacterized membrane protein YfcA
MNWLPAIDAPTLALLMLAAFVAGMARGFSGFGAALIFVPLAGALAGPKLAPPLLLVIDGVFASYLIPSAWRLGDRRDISLMLTGALVGVPAGAAILTRVAPISLRWLIAVSASAMLVLLLSGWRYRGRPHAAATVAVGLISGLFSGIAQLGGPPVMSYWLGADIDHAKVRANVILYFAASSVLTLISYPLGRPDVVSNIEDSALHGPGLWNRDAGRLAHVRARQSGRIPKQQFTSHRHFSASQPAALQFLDTHR